ncbi:MAG: type III PLP-dependent enzyme [Desulfobulbaceae bacterium]
MSVGFFDPGVSPGLLRECLRQDAPPFSEVELESFVSGYLDRRQVFLDILTDVASPLYVLDRAVLHRRAAEFQETFRSRFADTGFYYAVKSNNHPLVAATLVEAGMGLDVSSGLELEMALATEAKEIVFSGPGKTLEELRLAAHNHERVVLLIDSFGELERIGALLSGTGKTLRTGVRLTTDTRGLWRKFGIPPGRLPEFIARAGAMPQIRLEGIQFHTSWNMGPAPQADFIRRLGEVLSRLPQAALARFRFIDIGGGYWPSEGEWLQPAGTRAGMVRKSLGMEPGGPLEHYRIQASPLSAFAEEISRAVGEHLLPVLSCRICFEPGRWLSHGCMHLLLTVTDRKEDDLVITDGGTNVVGWERFETDYFPVINLSRPSLEEKPCHVLGSLCTPHDVWGYSYWGGDIREGDVLLIPEQGAYTWSLRQHFIKPVPEVVAI